MSGGELRRRSGREASPKLASLRAGIAKAAERYRLAGGVTEYRDLLGGIHCLVLTPPAAVRGRLLYFHGGGFRMGSPEIAAGFLSRIAARTALQVILPYYALAPENPFPAALLEGRAVFSSLGDDLPLLIGGDSAGGNLAAVLARWSGGSVAGLLLISPWLDLRVSAASYERNGETDPLFSAHAACEAAELYLQGHSALDPDASPLLGESCGSPPALILVGSTEVLLDDALAFANNLVDGHRTVSLHVLSEMQHVEPLRNPESVNARVALDEAMTFIESHLAVR